MNSLHSNFDDELMIDILYNNEYFWRTFSSYKYYTILQSVCKRCKIIDTYKFFVLISIGLDMEIDASMRTWIVDMFHLKRRDYKLPTKGSALFNFIKIKYNNSWDRVIPILKVISDERYLLEKALRCIYDIDINDVYIHLYNDVYNDIYRTFMKRKTHIKLEECAYKIYQIMVYKRYTNYFDIFPVFYEALGFGEKKLASYDNLKKIHKSIKWLFVSNNVIIPRRQMYRSINDYSYVNVDYNMNEMLYRYYYM